MNNISFCINTARNELNHIKLLFDSLQKNLSRTDHEVIVFIDSDNQGTFEWLLTQKSIFPNLKILKNELPICYGYARNINEMFEQAKNEIVSYLQSDMVVGKDYDLEILKSLTPNTFLCSTRVEPPLHPPSSEKITYDFGLDPIKFDLEQWTQFSLNNKQDKLTSYFFAPFTLYKKDWIEIGGHNTLYRRSREDSDVLLRLILKGINIKQTWSALVYHFTCTSSRGPAWFNKENQEAQQRLQQQQIADRYELIRFIKNWGRFSHGDLGPDGYLTPKFYKISAIINNISSINDFLNVELFFDRVYIKDKNLIPLVQNSYNNEHKIANQLLNISDNDWETYNYMYNQQIASSRIKLLNEQHGDDIVVEFDLDKLSSNDVNSFLTQLQFIIDQTEDSGKFQYGFFTITINNKVDRAKDKIKITNPEVKPEHLYTIY